MARELFDRDEIPETADIECSALLFRLIPSAWLTSFAAVQMRHASKVPSMIVASDALSELESGICTGPSRRLTRSLTSLSLNSSSSSLHSSAYDTRDAAQDGLLGYRRTCIKQAIVLL